jgi:5-methylcytosine-specific restriction endonuclease McrA
VETRKYTPYGYGPPAKKYRWRNAKRCYWCGRHVVYTDRPQGNQATREHLIPKSLKGDYHPMYNSTEMIVVACRRCNGIRGNNMDWIPYHLKGEQ